MKFVTLALIVSALTACGAASNPDVSMMKDVSDSNKKISIPSLPVLVLPKVIVKPAPGYAAVQPTAQLTFSYSSCARRHWSLIRETQYSLTGNLTFIQVEDKSQIDCMGPVMTHQYSIQISSDTMADGQYVIVNPTVIAAGSDM